MAEWHLTPEYILENWTDELFELMWEKRNEHMIAVEQLLAQANGVPSGGNNFVPPQPAKQVSDMEMFAKFGIGSA